MNKYSSLIASTLSGSVPDDRKLSELHQQAEKIGYDIKQGYCDQCGAKVTECDLAAGECTQCAAPLELLTTDKGDE